jgi:aspartokinase-like uncharacterized kinase
MWVIKLGGSLAMAAELRPWLAVIADTPGPPRVVVPGGGPFADAVRAAQERWRFDDRVAHRMALLAMHQYGLMLTGLKPTLRPAETVETIRTECTARHVPVWLPYTMVAKRDDIEASWEVTSDSTEAGILDGAFSRYAQAFAGEILCMQRSEHAALKDTLKGGGPAGTRVFL